MGGQREGAREERERGVQQRREGAVRGQEIAVTILQSDVDFGGFRWRVVGGHESGAGKARVWVIRRGWNYANLVGIAE